MFGVLIQECRAVFEHYSPGDKLRFKARWGTRVGQRRRQSMKRALRGKKPLPVDAPVSEHALSPDLHTNSVRAIKKEKDRNKVFLRPPDWMQNIPQFKAPSHRRGRNSKKSQDQDASGWNDVEEYGSRGRQHGSY